jgi:hypothetical protein
MNGSTSIFDFIDGALDHAREQELFDELARNPELRAELRQHIAIGEAVRADREAYVPPSDVEHALMTGLGLSPIASIGTAGAAATAGAAGAGLLARLGTFKGFAPLVGSFVAGLMIATGGYFAAFTASETSAPIASGVRDTIFIREAPRASDAPTATAPRDLASAQTPVREASPIVSADRPRQAPSVRSERVVPVERIAPVDRVTTPSESVETPSAIAEESRLTMGNLAEPVPMRLAERDAAPVIALDSAATTVAVRGLDQNAETFAALMKTRDRSQVFLEGRALTLTPFVDNNAHIAESSFGEEFTVGFLARTGESFSFGPELGQARFPQVLVYPETYTSDGRPVGQIIAKIEQDPSVMWAGLSGRQELGSLGARAPYWVQATLAYGFRQGPMLNTRAGINFDLSSRISLSGALETTSLVYFFNGQPLYTGKYGVSLGLQLGL